MNAPTGEEIQAGYDQITIDGPNAKITAELSLLTITDPIISGVLHRQAIIATAARIISISDSDRIALRAVLAGALIYGLHLGLHIGEARGREID